MTKILQDNFFWLLGIASLIFLVNLNKVWVLDEGIYFASPPALKPTLQTEQQQPHSPYRRLPQRDRRLQVLPGDYIYYKNEDSWDSSPIVVESHKLIFFTVPKVGCTVWKQLFRRMKHFEDWKTQEKGLPHDPFLNGLSYLNDFTVDEATVMMKSPEWTRAMMVRDPKQRLLSAFVDKSVRNDHEHIRLHCCKDGSCIKDAQTVAGFLRLCRRCSDDHWRPQNDRMEAKYWPYIDSILHIETAAEDAKALLQNIGAWDEYGATGWGKSGNLPIFQRQNGGEHSNFVETQVWKWYTPQIEQQVVRFYQQDYEHPLFQFNAKTCFTCPVEESSGSIK